MSGFLKQLIFCSFLLAFLKCTSISSAAATKTSTTSTYKIATTYNSNKLASITTSTLKTSISTSPGSPITTASTSTPKLLSISTSKITTLISKSTSTYSQTTAFSSKSCTFLNPCLNFGYCISNQSNRYTCVCMPGYSGYNCEICMLYLMKLNFSY